ncbi:MAG: efflux transporter outer membrane subunit [Leadbetterella sp.]|nr:efflux transporter outer membrane subunit [Leadbetterella sp.]
MGKALQNNLDIRTALQNVSISEAYMKQGNAGHFPTFTLGPNFTFTKTSANTQFGRITGSQTLTQFDITGNFAWEADVWGKIRSTKRGFVADYLRSISAHQAVTTQIISTVANTYYNLAALEEQKKVLEETIRNREEGVETNKFLKTAGIVSEVAVKQNEAILVNAQALLVDTENAIKLNENILSVLLGESPGETGRSYAARPLEIDVKTGFPVQLLENRPDVMAAEMALVKAFENVNVARSNFYPALRITASGGFQSIDFPQLFSPKSLFVNAVAGLAQPIYNRRTLKTQKEVADASQEQAYLAYQKAVITASREVSDALFNYSAADRKITLKEQEYQLYNQSVQYSEELLENGMANYLEVITAKQNALNTQLSIITTKLQKLNATVELYRALGGGWQ